jgi:hypothetical protein
MGGPKYACQKPDGSSRFCVDPKMHFSCTRILCPYRRISSPPLFEVMYVFSQIDFSIAYLKVELDDISKRLCNINTHRSFYK